MGQDRQGNGVVELRIDCLESFSVTKRLKASETLGNESYLPVHACLWRLFVMAVWCWSSDDSPILLFPYLTNQVPRP